MTKTTCLSTTNPSAYQFGRNISTLLGDSGNAVWLSQSVAVCTAVLAPVFSRGSDLFGRKYFVVLGCAAGFVGDLIVSRATSMNMAIAGAAISGISYGAQVSRPDLDLRACY
jgi:MFS family permease